MTFLSAIILLGLIIFTHEFGHFLFAKLLGVKVLKFSLGFGPRLVGRTYKDTEYLISYIPLGGYVKMLGENSDQELTEEEKPFAYNYQPVWKRFIIVFSGPFFNIIFALLLFIFIFLYGIPTPYPDVGKIIENSPGAKAGLITNDRVIAIDGVPVQSWEDINKFINKNPGKTLFFKVKRGEHTIELPVIPVKKTEKNIFGEEVEFWDIGVYPLLLPVIGEMVKGERAQKAGLQKGDRIIEIDGAVINTWQDMTEIIHNSPGKPLDFKIMRKNKVMTFTITPDKKTLTVPGRKEEEIGLIGINPTMNDFIKRYDLIESVSLGIKKTWEMSVLTVVAVIKIIQRVIPTNVIGGPILILQMAGEQASRGLLDFLFFMAIININIGILNLFPIPVLDGGHILFLGIEAVRRKPLSEKIIVTSQRIGIAILLMLMAFALYNDFTRLISGKQFP
jgi:regulator of sigma E protease